MRRWLTPSLFAALLACAAVYSICAPSSSPASAPSPAAAAVAVAAPAYVVHIFVFAWIRTDELERLLSSLRRSDLTPFPAVAVTIVVDGDAPTRVGEIARAFRLGGDDVPVRVVVRAQHVGLKHNIMSAYDGDGVGVGGAREFVVLLEDDLELAPHSWAHFVDAVVRKYMLPPSPARRGAFEHLVGVSLYSPRHEEVNGRHWEPDDDGHAVFALAFPASWGAVYDGRMWHRFRHRWARQERNGVNPRVRMRTNTNRWPPSRSWKKYAVHMFVEQRLLMLYPRLPARAQLCTNHIGSNSTNQLESWRRAFALPLLDAANATELRPSFTTLLPALGDVTFYDASHQARGTLQQQAWWSTGGGGGGGGDGGGGGGGTRSQNRRAR